MSSNDIAINVTNLSKCYQIYDSPRDRLKQFVVPHLQRISGKPPKQYFREFWALKDVSFEVKKGETVGIIGRNGSGKSTLLQMICGTLSSTAGIVQAQGRIAALLELGAGFNTEFTGRENIILNAAILGFPEKEISAKMDEILDFSELGEFIDQPVKKYSSGMFVRLSFSTAIHVNPAVLIVDEALAVGDAKFQAKCMHRIKEMKKQGTSIVFVSHDVTLVRTLCDRAVWLENGIVVDQGDVFPITGRYMESMFKDELTTEESHTSPTTTKPHIEKTEHELDSRPVTHWGSNKGIILSATVCDTHGSRQDVFPWGDRIEINIDVEILEEIPKENLSIAFSIKDTRGTDILTSTTYSSGTTLPNTGRFKVSFQMSNFLVTGTYILVAAVERHHAHDIHYYEYLEGAHYFSSLAKQQFFGIYQPQIDQVIKIEND